MLSKFDADKELGMRTTMFDTRSALHDMAHQIRACRTDDRLTLQKLASLSGVAASTIHKVESEQMVPTISVFLKIARGLGRRPDELIRDRQESSEAIVKAASSESDVGVWHIDLAAREPLPDIDLDPTQRAIVLVERGPIHLLAGTRCVLMKSGDCIAIDGGSIQSRDDRRDPAKLTLIISPPGGLDQRLGEPAPSSPVYQ